MRTALVILSASAALALLAWRFAPSAGPGTFFESASRELRSATCTTAEDSLFEFERVAGGRKETHAWRIRTPRPWAEYRQHVAARLRPRMRVLEASERRLLLRETLPADLLTVELVCVGHGDGQTDVRVMLRGEPW